MDFAIEFGFTESRNGGGMDQTHSSKSGRIVRERFEPAGWNADESD
jgi:hypothetical protein